MIRPAIVTTPLPSMFASASALDATTPGPLREVVAGANPDITRHPQLQKIVASSDRGGGRLRHTYFTARSARQSAKGQRGYIHPFFAGTTLMIGACTYYLVTHEWDRTSGGLLLLDLMSGLALGLVMINRIGLHTEMRVVLSKIREATDNETREILEANLRLYNGVALEWLPIYKMDLRQFPLHRISLLGLDIRQTLLPADCAKIDFTGAKLDRSQVKHIIKHRGQLCGADLSGINLKGIDLSKADLRFVNLQGTNLKKTRLPQDCAGIDFTGALLGRTEVMHIIEHNGALRGANLEGVDLSGMNLDEQDFTDVNLNGVILRNSVLSQSALKGVSLKNVDLRGAVLPDDCSGINFAGALLTDLQVWQILHHGGTVREAQVNDVDFSGRCLESPNFVQVVFKGADLMGASLDGAKFDLASLEDANMTDAKLRGASFTYANLKSAKLVSAQLSGSKLMHADLRRADLSYADLSGADLTEAKLSYAVLEGTRLAGATLPEDCSGVDARAAILSDAQREWIKHRGGLVDETGHG
ncbi:MAG: Pentapeptide repeat protein, partial [uncultured bacterium]